jgi:hypothetical protein
MDKDLARHVATTAFRSAVQLSDMIPLLKQHCDEAELKTFVKAIATANATIHIEIGNRIYAAYPELEQELENSIQKYGKLI